MHLSQPPIKVKQLRNRKNVFDEAALSAMPGKKKLNFQMK